MGGFYPIPISEFDPYTTPLPLMGADAQCGDRVCFHDDDKRIYPVVTEDDKLRWIGFLMVDSSRNDPALVTAGIKDGVVTHIYSISNEPPVNLSFPIVLYE